MRVPRYVFTMCLGLAGCALEDASTDGAAASLPAAATSASAGEETAVAPPAATSAPSAPTYAMPRPYRGRLETAVLLNATCVSCHEEEAEAWRGSRHHHAATDPAFRRAFAIEPTAFCRGCHAPESRGAETPPRAVSELGVGCVTCHVTEEGSVLAAPSAEGDAQVAAPHPLQRSAELAGTGACAGCHEFRFPGLPGSDDGRFMQTTVREHQRAPAAADSGAACHMPLVGGRRSHSFAEVRDPAWLRANLRATAERIEGGVRITLAQPAPGHAFPTGDLFRRLEVSCELEDASGRVLGRAVRHLARHFEIVPREPARQLSRDDRVFAEPVVVDLAVAPPASIQGSGALSWRVSLQRVATVGVGTNPADAKIESEVELYSGVLPWKTN